MKPSLPNTGCLHCGKDPPDRTGEISQHRWIIERDYEELKQELGFGHYEGRGWRGFHHHATLCIAAYGFLVIERSRFSPYACPGRLELRAAKIPPHFQTAARRTRAERHNPQSIATIRIGLPDSCFNVSPVAPSAALVVYTQ